MKQKLIVSCMEGASASIRPEAGTISSPLINVLMGYRNSFDISFNEAKSLGMFQKWMAYKWIMKQAGDDVEDCLLYLVGKSYGGAKTWDMAGDRWNEFKKFQSVKMLLVDAHGRIAGDGSVAPIGHRNEMEIMPQWKHSLNSGHLSITNIYQRNDWPYGGNFPGATENLLVSDAKVDHFNIVNHGMVEQAIIRHMNSFK